VNDEALAAVAQSRNKLESVYPIIAPQNDSIQYFLDKERMLDAAQSIGIPTPRCYGRAVREAADCSDMSFPVIVKPLSGFRFQARFGCKVFVATSRSELKKAIARVEEARIPCQVYDIVPGPDSRVYCHCMYIDANGNLRADITWRKIRQSPPMFGVARVAEVVPNDARMQESTLEFLRQIRFRGIAVAEYKHDPRDGTFRILEINGRSILCNNLLRRAGVDLAGLAWSDYIERCPETARTQHWPGVWINLHADLLYSILRSRKENLALKDFLAPYRRPMIEAVWSARDPKPFLVEWGRTLGKSLRLFG
jgi:D-aspartate ligase